MVNLKKDIQIEYSQGGMREMMDTGVYPEYLTFYSKKLEFLDD